MYRQLWIAKCDIVLLSLSVPHTGSETFQLQHEVDTADIWHRIRVGERDFLKLPWPTLYCIDTGKQRRGLSITAYSVDYLAKVTLAHSLRECNTRCHQALKENYWRKYCTVLVLLITAARENDYLMKSRDSVIFDQCNGNDHWTSGVLSIWYFALLWLRVFSERALWISWLPTVIPLW